MRTHYKFRIIWLILAVCVGVFSMQSHVLAGTQTDNGDIDVSAIVPGPPPATAPVITSPLTNTTVSTKNIIIKGECIDGLVVKIFSNTIFIGSALCSTSGTFELQVDLFEGKNDLVARQYDMLNQPSPDSDTIVVYYVPLASQPTLPPSQTQPPSTTPSEPTKVAQFQLKIIYDYTQQGVFIKQPFHLPIHFVGGTPPYAVSIDWGDGKTNVYSRANTDQFGTDHTYDKAGYYTIKIRVSDKDGNEAYLQFVLLVNGGASAPVVRTFTKELASSSGFIIIISLPMFLLGYLIGRWHERHRMKSKLQQQNISQSS